VTKPFETTLRILHVSDLHEQGQNENATWRRQRVLGAEFQTNLAAFRASGPIDLIFFTGDLANWGIEEQYDHVTSFLEDVLANTGVDRSRLFVVPGNHDVNRKVAPIVWKKIRAALQTLEPRLASDWMARGTVPPGFKGSWRQALLERQSAFWSWVANKLRRPELLPERSPHGSLGYRVTLDNVLPCPLHVIGLDTAWLAGDDNDTGQLALTADQIGKLCTDDQGSALPGLRLALLHHPITELRDQAEAWRLLADHVDIVFRGHMHDPEAQTLEDPDRQLRVLAAGCLYDVTETTSYPNECQLLEVRVGGSGTIVGAELWCRAWSTRGFWQNADSYYRNSTKGRVDVWSPKAPSTCPSASISLTGTSIRLRGEISAADPLGRMWGSPEGDPGVPIDLVIEGPVDQLEGLSSAVMRLGLHGGVRILHVDEPAAWDRLGRTLITCIGVDVSDWRWSSAPSSTSWRILDRSSAPPVSIRTNGDVAVETFAADLHRDMDRWVWARITYLMKAVLAGDEERTHVAIHESIRTQMATVWAKWSHTLDVQPNLLKHFLSAMLTTATPLRSDTARARLGPHVIERGLLRALLFALSVDVGLLAETGPHEGGMPINLVFCDADAHLVALELISNKFMHTVVLDLAHEPPFLLLANCRASAEQLQDNRQRIGNDTASPIRIGSVDLSTPFTFTADPSFDIALRDGLEPLRNHFRTLAERSVTARQARISYTAENA
jgi:hypothetical protein